MSKLFDGIDDRVAFSTYQVPTNLTVSYWFRITALANDTVRGLWAVATSNLSDHTAVGIRDAAGTKNIRMWNEGASGLNRRTYDTTDAALVTGTWYHLALSQAGPAALPNIYINGVAKTVTESETVGNAVRTNSTESLGNFGAYLAGLFYNGNLSHVSVWEDALSAADCYLLYLYSYASSLRFSVGGTAVPLHAYWPLWESAAATALDHSGGGLNGTVTGTTLEEDPISIVRRPAFMTLGKLSADSIRRILARNVNLPIVNDMAFAVSG